MTMFFHDIDDNSGEDQIICTISFFDFAIKYCKKIAPWISYKSGYKFEPFTAEEFLLPEMVDWLIPYPRLQHRFEQQLSDARHAFNKEQQRRNEMYDRKGAIGVIARSIPMTFYMSREQATLFKLTFG